MSIKLPTQITKETERSEQKDFFVPDGTYLCMLNKIEEKPKSEEESFAQCEYEILDVKKGEERETIGLRVFDILNLNEKSLWRQMNFLDAVYPPKFEGDEIPSDIEGKWVVLTVRNEKYNGKSNLRVKKFESAANWSGETLKTNDEGQQVIEGNGSNKSSGGKTTTTKTGRVSI